jgi:hypothetical protein
MNPYTADFWALRSQYAPAEVYYFALLLYPRATLLYTYMVDEAAASVFLSDPSSLSLILFGTAAPHALALYNFYGYACSGLS